MKTYLVLMLSLLALKMQAYTEEKVNLHFQEYDLDKDGRLERTEYVRVMQGEDHEN
jgi:Ca2+-binding EF-hand superfamily protein